MANINAARTIILKCYRCICGIGSTTGTDDLVEISALAR
jgi:hypothetical protein